MTSVRHTYAFCVNVALPVALALALVGCGGGGAEDRDVAAIPRAADVTVRAPLPPPAPPQVAIRVVDGDSGKPVRGARVLVSGDSARSASTGVAQVAEPIHRRFRVVISARGYERRSIVVTMRGDQASVPVWRTATQWPIYGATPARTQVHPAIKLRPPFRRIWHRKLHGLIEFPAVVWQGVAYVNNFQGWLRAIDVRTGRVLWQRRIGSLIAASPAVDPKRKILVTTTMQPGYAYAISLANGKVKWRYYTGMAEPSPVIRSGVAYFGTTGGNVYALDLDRRKPRWVFHGGVKITSSPALVGNRLYFGDYAGRVFALDSRNGRVVWQGSAGTRVYGTVAVSHGRVFAPSVFSGLSALSARTGRLLWRIPVGVYLYSSPAVFRGRVYFGTYAGLVYSADARTGKILWSRPAGGAVSGAVQVVSGVVYAGSMGSRITAWSWRGGRELWTFPHGRYVPVSGNGSVLLMHGGSAIWGVVPKRRR
jgi:outer membrane protein assembly factor BamB